MRPLLMPRLPLLAAGVLLFGMTGPARADDTKGAEMKLPPLDDTGWKKQDNGMRVWDVKEGTGEAAKKDSTIKIHYTGWLLDGTVFDSSKKRNEPITFPLDNLIKGWQVGVPGMKPGGVRRLEIPYQLAYGERGSPPTIPAKATLVFEIELIEVKK